MVNRYHNKKTEMSYVAMYGCLLGITLALFIPNITLAGEDDGEREKSRFSKLTIIPSGQVINEDVFAFGERVEISGTVHGDVYAGGGQILVDGTINGDLLAAGGTVSITGTVTQDIRIAGGNITINGTIERNASIAGGNVEMTPSAAVKGSLVLAGGSVELGAPIEKDIKVTAGNLAISNVINGHVHAAAGTVRLTSKAQIDGNLHYWSRKEASIDEQATVSGKIFKRSSSPKSFFPSAKGMFAALAGLKILFTVTSFVSTLILGLLIIHFYPHATQLTMTTLEQQPGFSLVVGVFGLFGIPLLVGLFAISVIGLPLAMLLLAWYIIVLYVARIFVIAWAGQKLSAWLGKPDHRKSAFLIGLILYSLLAVLPFIGGLVTFFTTLLGVGLLLLMKKEIYSKARQQEMI